MSDKTSSPISLLRFSWWQLGLIGVIIGALYAMGNYNVQLSEAKARDWSRKEHLKQVYLVLREQYLIDNNAFPPHDESWQLTGCGDAVCPTSELGTSCSWVSGSTPGDLTCGGEKYLAPLPGILDLANTPEPDSPRYVKTETARAYLEVCLELDSDDEAQPVSTSKTGYTTDGCPSGMIFQWPKLD